LTTKSTPTKQPSSAAKNRLNPIKETMQTVRGYPTTLVIYKTAASRFYWVRCYFNGKYRTKTTKSESAPEAKQFAVQFFRDTVTSKDTNLSGSTSKHFAVVGNLFFRSTEKNSTSTTYKSDYNRYCQHILKEFNQQPIDTITNAQISQFVEKLHDTKIKPATIKHHIVVLRKIMKFAIANDLMKSLPVFPRITGKLQTSLKRDYLTIPEYEHICKTAQDLAQKKVIHKARLITLEMKLLIQFMVNSFIRPSDLRVIKHKHVTKQSDKDGDWLELTHPATKTNANAVQAMPASVHIYQRLIEFRKEEKRNTTLDDYVFFPEFDEHERDEAMIAIAKLFKRIVAESGLEVKTDKKITLYSLRHTAIMFRLTIGQVDTLSLARNARTSQAMLDQFYASHLTSGQMRKQLHAFPGAESKNIKGKATKKPSASVTLDLMAEPTKMRSKRKLASVDSVHAETQKKIDKAAPSKS
jgi:site-specific recombinase XerD